MTVPADPRITPCNHLFCHACIHQALDSQLLCPIDRQPCSRHQLRPLDGLISRVWGGIQVKCGYHEHGCVWRGSIADYSAHLKNCSISNNPTIRDNAAAKEELERLKRENIDLRRQLDSVQMINARNEARFRQQLGAMEREVINTREKLEIVELVVGSLQGSLRSCKTSRNIAAEYLKLVMDNTACSKEQASRALTENDNDLVGAIMSLRQHMKDIALVMSQAGCSRAVAIKALRDNDGDLVDSIMSLTVPGT